MLLRMFEKETRYRTLPKPIADAITLAILFAVAGAGWVLVLL
jgi:energy-coupling factor transporter transmembrane protein EcfT